MTIAIDGHVHIYSDFSTSRFFDAAWENCSKLSSGQGLPTSPDCALFLTEGGENNVFKTLWQMAESQDQVSVDSFRFLRTGESNSLIVEKGDKRMFFFAGRQHVSQENIELLSLFSKHKINDRSLPLAELAQTVADNGGVVVLPWGVGKWFGKRGDVVKRLLTSDRNIPLFCGDNGNRPLLWPTPSLLRFARKNHIPILSGSDPLPLASHCNRVASFGTLLLQGKLPKSHPAASLRDQLSKVENLREFGSRYNPVRFFCDQLRINLFNRR